jgi:hypothetical protein|tara:strand:+ start:373 stop:651 length:279 start_codon:yes stop_codon:yes gene_type:complete
MRKKYNSGQLVGGQKKLDKNKDGRISGEDFKLMSKGGRAGFRKGGDTHVTKDGKVAKKGLWYNIHQKRKKGKKMRKKGAKGAPTAEAIRKSQ